MTFSYVPYSYFHILGAVIESRIYTPFGRSNVSKISDNILPIGYMGFIEINGIVFVYDKANQVTRPLNLQTGRFQTSSFMSVKPVIDVFNPNLEIDLFYFHHGRSVSNIFPTSKSIFKYHVIKKNFQAQKNGLKWLEFQTIIFST